MSNEAQAVRAQIEAALAAGPTPGAWTGQEFDEALTGDSIPSFVALPMGRNHHDSAVDAAYIAACNPANIRTLLADHDAQLRAANELAERLKLEAQAQAQEAKTANSTIAEIYQLVSGKSGEPGNWHGAKPVLEYMRAANERIAALTDALNNIILAADSKQAQGGEMWFAEAVSGPIEDARASLQPSGASHAHQA